MIEDMLWPSEFSFIETEECDAPSCHEPVAYAANMGLGGERQLCEGHFEKWCREYDERPRHHIEQPKYLSFQEYFAKDSRRYGERRWPL